MGVDATAAFVYLSEDFEFVNDDESAMPGTRQWHAGFAAAMQSADDVFEYFRHEPIAYTACGHHVLVEVMLHARGRAGQVELSTRAR
jgi:hypothetical protein